MTRIIDGRKATVINVGAVYATFNDFAIRNGYPEAVDGKTRIKNGDVVTLLTSQTHGPHSSTVLWIVENADGERQVIGEGGLDIHETQYTEVRRKAHIGERIKIVAACCSNGYKNGDTGVVVKVYGDGGVSVNREGDGFKMTLFHSEYVVLQPILTFKWTATARIEAPETVSIQASATVSIADFQALQRKVDAMETTIKRLDTQLRVAREDIVIIEEGVSGDISRLEAAVFPSKWRR